MVFRKISDYPSLPDVQDDDLVLIGSGDNTYTVKGSVFKAFVAAISSQAVTAAKDAQTAAAEAALAAASVDPAMFLSLIAGKGDNLEFDADEGKLYLTSGGERISDGITVITQGAFARDPLYNGLQNRKVRTSADVTTLLTLEEVRGKSAEELDAIVQKAFDFDNLAEQYERGVKITETFRADGLHRILYKCPACMAEGDMEGKGTELTCHACGKTWFLNEDSRLEATDGVTEFPHIPDWYDWERQEVKREIDRGEYRLDTPVQIGLMVDYKGLYMVGDGWLTHSKDGFRLTGCKGKLNYEQKPCVSHTLNADFYWYCIGDVIGIGNRDCLYYCFPKDVGGRIPPVAKARLATEELYKAAMAERRRPSRTDKPQKGE